MKKLLGLGFILVALAVVTMGMVGFPKLDVNIWPLFPVLLFAFFTLENLLKKDYKASVICALIAFMIAKCDLRCPAGFKWSGHHSRCARLRRS